MAIFIALWVVSLGLPVISWRYGGEPERRGAALILAAYLVSICFGWLRIEGLKFGVIASDLGLAIGLAWLAMSYRRWWLLLAAANAILVVVAHASVFMETSIHQRAYIAYRLLPGLMIPIAAGVGAIERWLAGETAFGERLPSRET